MKAKHATTWEDGQSAGLSCEGVEVDQVISIDHDQPETCARCSAKVRLIWEVRVDEVFPFTRSLEDPEVAEQPP